ncbi:peptidoglycan-binding protein LysM [Moraxella bovoculi]|uniref:peptidoglycan-binding protein LysM n=1 Tax=Moraxella bovoculi TaxID=386891 RepID=UPI00156EFDEC|nr:peptidoglycan-binding protein LysM [Moraxella bovoculi]NSM10675.1 peptidoglycan-binding protein LysM [Moraxella bovoculi]
MGIFSFAKDIGDKIFNRNKKDAAPAPAANTAAPAEPTAQEIANLLLARVQAQNVQISNLSVNYNSDTDTVTLSGAAKTQEDRERARLAVGNVQHVETVVDNITVESQESESRFYTVKSGDNLSKIAKEMYGNANDYMKIFDANKPMLSHPDKIYPGQVLRIPA